MLVPFAPSASSLSSSAALIDRAENIQEVLNLSLPFGLATVGEEWSSSEWVRSGPLQHSYIPSTGPVFRALHTPHSEWSSLRYEWLHRTVCPNKQSFMSVSACVCLRALLPKNERV